MILGFLVVVFFYFLLRGVMRELQRQDEALLNATLSNNSQLFSSLGNDFDDAWLTARVLNNVSDEAAVAALVPVEPAWDVVLGSFLHDKDENFFEFLVAAGVPAFVRSMIVRSTPTVTIERAYQDDHYDYYYDLGDDHYPNTDFPQVGGDDDPAVYQMVITTSTWLRTNVERFRPGYTWVKDDYDGTPSKNTYTFATPTVLVHHKEKETISTSILRTFTSQGFVMTIVNKDNGMVAKRHFTRSQG